MGMKYFIDKRDGRKYPTVEIGGKVWLAKNLNFKAEGSVPTEGTGRRRRGATVSDAVVGRAYGDKHRNGKIFGRLYDWKTAQTALPEGWRLPTGKEWQTLIYLAGGLEICGTNLKAVKGWRKMTDDEYRERLRLAEACPNCIDKNGVGIDKLLFGAKGGGSGFIWGGIGDEYEERPNIPEQVQAEIDAGNNPRHAIVKGDSIFYDIGDRGTWWSSTTHQYAGKEMPGVVDVFTIRADRKGVCERQQFAIEGLDTFLFSVRCILIDPYAKLVEGGPDEPELPGEGDGEGEGGGDGEPGDIIGGGNEGGEGDDENPNTDPEG